MSGHYDSYSEEEPTDNDYTERNAPERQRMGKRESSGKSWVSNVRQAGDRTLFGKTGIQIKGFPKTGKQKKTFSQIQDSSDDSDSTIIDVDELLLVKTTLSKRGANQELSQKNSSLASTECDIQDETSKNKKKNAKRRRHSFLQSERRSIQVPSKEQKQKQHVKKIQLSHHNSSESSETTETTETDEALIPNNVDSGKRRRQYSGPIDTHSTMCASKKIKTVYVDSTEDSSDVLPAVKPSHSKQKNLNTINEDSAGDSSDLKFKSLKTLPKHNNKRKSENIENSSSSEEEKSQRKNYVKKKQKNEKTISSLATPKLTLEFSSSGDEDLPALVRPRKRHSSDSSTKSTQSNTSTVAYGLTPYKDKLKASVKEEESETDSDVPLDKIMQKRSTEAVEAFDSDTEESQSLLPQLPKEEQTSTETTEKYLSAYTQEEDCIFICDSDDDIYSSMSQQNLNFDFDEKRAESENEDDEVQLTRFFLGEEDEENNTKPSSDFFNTETQKLEVNSDDNLLTPVKPLVKGESKPTSFFDADTQIVICDDFDSDDDRLFDAETQINYDTISNVKEEKKDSDESTQDYYDAPTQVDYAKPKTTGRKNSFNLEDISDEEEESFVPLSPMKKSEIGQNKSVKNVSDKKTKVDRQNKHSIVQRLSDEGFTIEHKKVQTVKVTKQFNSKSEAQKYLKKVHSSENIFDEPTQEYDWEDEHMKSNSFRKKDVVKTEMDISPYDAMTQKETSQHGNKGFIKSEISSRFDAGTQHEKSSPKNVKEEFDPYSAQTQVNYIIDISDDEHTDAYIAATQKDSIGNSGRKHKGKSVRDETDLYTAETQIDIDILPEAISRNRISLKKTKDVGIKHIGDNVSVGIPKNIMDDMSKMEFKSERNHDYYNQATQVVQDDVNTESDEEVYTAATQAESNFLSVREERDAYNAQTLATDLEHDSSDFYNEQTQVDFELIKPKVLKRNVFSAMTQVEPMENDTTDDPYLQQTQVMDFDEELSDNDLVYGMATQVQDPVLESEEEETEVKESDDNVIYVPMLDDEDDHQEEENTKPLSENDNCMDYVVMLDSPSPPRNEEKKTTKKDGKYDRHTMLKTVSSSEKKTIQIAPVKPKSTKEKRESFKLAKEKFYSKKPDKKHEQRSSRSPEVNSDIKVVEDKDKDWFSKHKRSNEDKKKSKFSKHFERPLDKNLGSKIQEAKEKMVERELKQTDKAKPVKRRHVSVEGKTDVGDVKLPDEKTILAKGLPLLEFPGDKVNDSPQKTATAKSNNEDNSSKLRIKEGKCESIRTHSLEGKHDKHRHKSSHRNSEHSKDHDHKKSDDNKDHSQKSRTSSHKSHDHKEESHKDYKSSGKRSHEKRESRGKNSHDRDYGDMEAKQEELSNHRKKSSSTQDDKKSYPSEKDRHKRNNKSQGSSEDNNNSKLDRKKIDENSKKSERRDKENNRKSKPSSIGKIPKISDRTKTVQQTEISTKSPLTSLDGQGGGGTLDSQSVSGLMSLIGMAGTGSVHQRKSMSPPTQTVSYEKTDGTSSPVSPIKAAPMSMYRERTLNDIVSDNKGPKSILSKPGPRSKHLRKVTFKIPSYSQTAENQAKNNAQKVYKEDNIKNYIKQHFPNGIPDLGMIPNQVPQQQGPNLMHKLTLQQQACRAMPGSAVPQQMSATMPNTNRPVRNATVPAPVQTRTLVPAAPIRIPVPVFNEEKSPQSEIPITDLDYFFTKILKWNATWLDEYEKHRVTPPDIENAFKVKHLLNSYDNYEDYFVRLFPHLFLETWESCLRSWLESKGKNKRALDIAFTRVDKPNEKILVYTFTAVAPRNGPNVLYEGDIVTVSMWGVGRGQQKPRYYLQFGYIERIKYHRYKDSVDKILQTFPMLAVEGKSSSDLIGLEITVKTRLRQFKMLSSKRSTITSVTSLVSTVRQYIALSHVFRTTIINHILSPSSLRVFHNHPCVKEQDREGLENYNPSQQKAITIASKIAIEPPVQNRIVLLQGPPGTGKSFTIVGIIKKIFERSNGRCKICLCAPSNSAVDELIKRLITERRKMIEEKKNPFGLVRIGKQENMHQDVLKYTFQEILKSNLDVELKRKMRAKVGSSEFKELNTLTSRIQRLQLDMEEKTVRLQNIQAGKLMSEITKLQKKKNDMEAEIQQLNKDVKLTRDEEENVKKNILIKSHIVCGTLSSFGHHQYMNILAPLQRENQIRRSYFNCIIVDEASQATELDTLIPLQYGTSKMILVGDPEQLPPTVLSQKCALKSFGQSLFERFFNHFKHEEVNPVLFLDTQYRMHPDIAYFPSKFVYLGALKTDESVKGRCNKLQLRPYVVFDMQEGQEVTTRRGAIINSIEAEFTIELCEFLIKRGRLQQKEIGIIAPYQQQKKIIKEGLKSSQLDHVEVNTVDGFQGREKEVIILSCTRAKNSSGGIGFLANSKRMNVALTRGKSALYVIGCLDSLKKGDSAWKSLIEDAESRHVITKVDTQGSHEMFNACLKTDARLGRQFVS